MKMRTASTLQVALVVLAHAVAGQGQSSTQYQWKPVTRHLSTGYPTSDITVYTTGPHQRPFPRPPPHTIDPALLIDFKDSFNLLQDVSATGDNTFTDVSPQYVAAIPGAFVEGEAGMIYDAAGWVYHTPFMFHNRTNPTLPLPQRTPSQAVQQCTHHYPRMATVIQRYGHMYYHWLEETLPRVVMLQDAGALTPDTKLLVWGQPYEAAWLQTIGVRSDQLVKFDPEAVYCADVLLVPTPVPRITPPKEALLAVRSALGVRVLPEAERTTIIYVSRTSEPTRRVAKEAQILNAIKTFFPANPLAVFNGNMAPAEAIELFQKARVVIGPHGAGLSHILFSAPGTAVVEFLFMSDPPMMFWHTAAALGQDYWLLPVPQSYYMQREMNVPEGEVMDILTAALTQGVPPVKGACLPGTAGRAGGLCSACPPGSYAFNINSKSCKLCAPGRIAAEYANEYCSTCPAGTVANDDATACEPCPKGTYSTLAGSSDPAMHCLTAETRRQRMEEQALSVEMLTKLSPVFAQQMKRRRLVQGGATIPLTLSQAELCAARRDATGGPYLSGPYGFDGSLCPPTSTLPTTPPPPGEEILVPMPSPSPPPYGLPDIPPIGGVLLPPGLPQIPPIDTVLPSPLPPPPPPSSGKEPDGVVKKPDEDLRGDPVTPPPPPTDDTGGGDGDGQPIEPLPPSTDWTKKMLDKWVIALIVTASLLVILPLVVCAGLWCIGRRRRSKVTRTPTVGPIPAPVSGAPGAASKKNSSGSKPFTMTNPSFDLRASTSGSGHGSASSKH